MMISNNEPLKKTTSFPQPQLQSQKKKSPSNSMQGFPIPNPNPHPAYIDQCYLESKSAATAAYANNAPPQKSNLIEFPTSPQLILGQELLHFKHPQHLLIQVDLLDRFACAGCKEFGSGKRFSCPQCDFQLHEFCALAPQSLKSHPLHRQHQLLFFSKPVKGGILKPKCDVCGKATKGFRFKCNACGYQMHPCCAMLSMDIKISVHAHPLRLLPLNLSSSSGGGGGVDTLQPTITSGSGNIICGECNRRRSGRVYRCTVCENYYLHAVCAKNMINGLPANGIKPTGGSSMLGTAVDIVSRVAIEFIGGLIEGFGEGVGQVLVQSIFKGRRNGQRGGGGTPH